MTRKEGIAKAWQAKNGQCTVPNAVFEFEYTNYQELCAFSSEQPKPIPLWLQEEIVTEDEREGRGG